MRSLAEIRALIQNFTVGLVIAGGLWWLATKTRDPRRAIPRAGSEGLADSGQLPRE